VLPRSIVRRVVRCSPTRHDLLHPKTEKSASPCCQAVDYTWHCGQLLTRIWPSSLGPKPLCTVVLSHAVQIARLGFELRAQLDFERCKLRVEHSECSVALLFVERRRLRRRSLFRNSSCYLRCAAPPLSNKGSQTAVCLSVKHACASAHFQMRQAVVRTRALSMPCTDPTEFREAVRCEQSRSPSLALHHPCTRQQQKSSLGSDRSAQLIGCSAHRCS